MQESKSKRSSIEPMQHAPSVLLEDVEVRPAMAKASIFSLKSLKVSSRERLLIYGPSGRGKTTFLHLIAGLLPPVRGRVYLDDTNLYELSDSARTALRWQSVGIIFQSLNLLDHLTAGENVALSLAGQQNASKLIQESLSKLGILELEKIPAGRLSLGQQQRVAVARVLAARPRLILADEPTSSLDEDNAAAVLSALIDASSDATLIMVSHDRRIQERFEKILDFGQLVKS